MKNNFLKLVICFILISSYISIPITVNATDSDIKETEIKGEYKDNDECKRFALVMTVVPLLIVFSVITLAKAGVGSNNYEPYDRMY